MKNPDKIYVTFEHGHVVQVANAPKDAKGNSVFLEGTKPVEFIRKDVIMKELNNAHSKSIVPYVRVAMRDVINKISKL